MRRLFLFLLTSIILAQITFGQSNDAIQVQFIVVRLDYLSYSLKYIYCFNQSYQISSPQDGEKVYGKLYVKIVPAMDFGNTTIRSSQTGNVVYEAKTVWAGSGNHIFPTEEFIVPPGEPGHYIDHPVYFDVVDYFFHGIDSTSVDTVWNQVKTYVPVSNFSSDKFGVLIYLHYFSVGLSNPYTAEWIVIFYSFPEFSSPGSWVSISGDLPNLHINSIAPHPFYTDSLFIGTDMGAFQTAGGGKHWKQIKFGENSTVKVTQIRAEMHPYLDWTVPVLWLGTEEYTMIPEDRLGRIFFSENGASEWKNTYFPKIAVSALEVPYDSSLVAFAGAYNPFYNQDGFFASDDTGWVKYDLTPGDTTAIRINCIEVDETNPYRIFLATSNGVFATTNGGKSWTQTDPYHPSTAIAISPFNPKEIYAILLFGTRSEGIYRSIDDGKSWERRCWTVNAVTLIPNIYIPGVWYWAVKNIGVFKSIDDCSTHIEISEGLKEKDILCLAQDRRNPRILYAGTTNGIFRYEESATNIWHDGNIQKQNIPRTFKVYSAYPNPFNSTTVIRLKLFESNRVSLKIYNVLGQLIRTLIDEKKEAGMHIISWDGTDNAGRPVSTGIYMCSMVIDQKGEGDIQKLILIK